jgi:hypothetical protein
MMILKNAEIPLVGVFSANFLVPALGHIQGQASRKTHYMQLRCTGTPCEKLK